LEFQFLYVIRCLSLTSTLFPYSTLFRSMNGTFLLAVGAIWSEVRLASGPRAVAYWALPCGTYGNWAVTTLAAILGTGALSPVTADRKSTRLNSSHVKISYAVFCLKKIKM